MDTAPQAGNETRDGTTVADEEQNDDPPSGKNKRLILGVLVLLLAGGAGAGWFFLLGGNDSGNGSGNAPEGEPGAAAEPTGPAQYVDLGPSFIVNFPHQGRQRYMQAELSVLARDDAAVEAVRQHMPAIRHRLITLFNAQLLLVFEDPAGVNTLRELATEEVRQVLQEELGRPGIEEVLFTTFVMQ